MNYRELFAAARTASESLQHVSDEEIRSFLLYLADETERRAGEILRSNGRDLAKTSPENPFYDRLKLDESRVAAIAADMRKVAELPSPLGELLWETTRPNGMTIKKISVPFGVIGIIYEARPNVSFDVFSLCLKSGNACVLKGGTDAAESNGIIVEIIRKALSDKGFDPNIVTLMPPGRESAAVLLEAVGEVDVVIPRGSKGLIDYVKNHAKVPVIETGAGICHTYFDKDGDVAIGADVVCNAKTRRVSVCNALDCLVIHRDRLGDLPAICRPLAGHGVVIYADEPAYNALQGEYPAELLQPADEQSYGTEFLSYKMSIRTVASFEEALRHISKYSSKHSEAIISENQATLDAFCRRVDAACVYANVSTAFTDGGQFGFGAEIGISTQKLHARGPMALRELTTWKYVIAGHGQTRPR